MPLNSDFACENHSFLTFYLQKISHEALKNSFNTIPQCDLVFHPSRKAGAAGFFLVMAFMQESSSQTVMYASASLKKVFVYHMTIGSFCPRLM